MPRKQTGYWANWKNLKAGLQQTVKELGYFPSAKDLIRIGHADIANGIYFHGGYSCVRAKMGYSRGKWPSNHWRKYRNVKIELEKMAKKLGHFPDSVELTKAGYGGLLHTIFDRYGGLQRVQIRMGYKPKMITRYHWHSWGNVKNELKKVVIKIGRFPTGDDLAKDGLAGLSTAISIYHHGYASVRARMGYTTVNAELLKLHAAALVRVFFALQKKMPGLKSDMLWMAIKKKWYAPDMERALKKAKRGNLKAFQQLLAS